MTRKSDVAIVGTGIAGLAAASFLAEQGHNVIVYDKFEKPTPVGSGFLLQPETGLNVLTKLGLREHIIQSGRKIENLYGYDFDKQSPVVNIRYADVNPEYFGVGIHRADVFDALYKKAKSYNNVLFVNGANVTSAYDHWHGAALHIADTRRTTCYDLVIDASGQNSTLRKNHVAVSKNRPCRYGALWGNVNVKETLFNNKLLEQRYKSTQKMVGILPLGSGNQDVPRAAFFWSLRCSDYTQWRDQKLNVWKQEVKSIWPQTGYILDQFTSHDDLTLATYRDVALRRFHSYRSRIAYIGDAAHSTSPQLGQGANLGLMDAWVLSESLKNGCDIPTAIQAYSAARLRHNYFYQMASRIATPFFQSDYAILSAFRSCAGAIANNAPYLRRVGARILAGNVTSIPQALGL
jgi:2-polyprenyl-6-methoxyphenol hydroxylase-like FAD-dependent oxidoreductase